MKEYQLQKAVCKYLDLKNVLYCGSMGGNYQKYFSQRNKAKATGYKKGFPDLFIYEISKINKKLMKWELSNTFNIEYRLKRWVASDFNKKDDAPSIYNKMPFK